MSADQEKVVQETAFSNNVTPYIVFITSSNINTAFKFNILYNSLHPGIHGGVEYKVPFKGRNPAYRPHTHLDLVKPRRSLSNTEKQAFQQNYK